MDIKIISAILISTILGSVIGFSLTYFVLHSQIQILQKELSTTKNEVDDLGSLVDTVTSSLSNVDNKVASLQSNMTSHKSNINVELRKVRDTLSDTQAQIQGLSSTIDEVEEREWYLIEYVSGRSDTTTAAFLVKGKELRIEWYMIGNGWNSWIAIGIYYQNGTYYDTVGSSGYYGSYYCDVPIMSGQYFYLNITTNGIDEFIVSAMDYTTY